MRGSVCELLLLLESKVAGSFRFRSVFGQSKRGTQVGNEAG